MSPEVGRAGFGVAMFIIVTSLILLLFLRPGTAEFSITVVTLVMGLIFTALVAILVRVSSR